MTLAFVGHVVLGTRHACVVDAEVGEPAADLPNRRVALPAMSSAVPESSEDDDRPWTPPR
jgi:hypothetical protein